jgi:hypothetical protein
MVESVKAKAERSIFSIKKGTILSDLIPRLKLPHEPLFAKIDEQIMERKSSLFPFSFDILLKKSRKKNNWGLAPFLFKNKKVERNRKWGQAPIIFKIRRFS